MDYLNNSHLIAGFFRYHREKLNYSLRGLVGNGSVVDLSSLSAFEHGKKELSVTQLEKIFKMIGYNYTNLQKMYDFENEYNQIISYIFCADTKSAEKLYFDCVSKGVFNTLGVLNFSLLQFVLSELNSKFVKVDIPCTIFEDLYSQDQKTILLIAKSLNLKNSGDFENALRILGDAEKNTFNPNLKAWVMLQFGIYYGILGNYAEAIIALLEAKNRYSNLLSFICLVQVNLNLGSVYFLTNSFMKSEEAYLDAYKAARLLHNTTFLLTKCFNSLCWLYFETNQYDKVDKLLDEKPEELVESRNTYFILAWAYYKLGKNEEAIQYCREGLEKFSKYTYVCMIYEYIEKACKGIKTGQDALLRKIIETEDYDHDALTEKLFTYELIDIYERRKNYEKAFKYAKKLLNR